MYTGLMNWFEKTAGGRLFHCRYCRIQFYDRRSLPAERSAAPGDAEKQETATQGHTAGGDAA
jgi:hypothetical protein